MVISYFLVTLGQQHVQFSHIQFFWHIHLICSDKHIPVGSNIWDINDNNILNQWKYRIFRRQFSDVTDC